MSVATSVLEGPGSNSSLGAYGAQADIQGLERSVSHPIPQCNSLLEKRFRKAR